MFDFPENPFLRRVAITVLSVVLCHSVLCAQAGESEELNRLLKQADKNKKQAFSSDGQYLAEFGGTVNIWSLKEKRRIHRIVVDGKTLSVAFAPNGAEVVTADGVGNLDYVSTVKTWDLKTGKERTIAKCLGSVTSFSFSPDGERLAATVKLNLLGSIGDQGDDLKKELDGGRIYVWQLSDGRQLLNVGFELPGLLAKLQAEPASGVDVAYEKAARKIVPIRVRHSADGSRLIAVTGSGEEVILDSKTGRTQPPRKSTSTGEQDSTGQSPLDSKQEKNQKSKSEPEVRSR